MNAILQPQAPAAVSARAHGRRRPARLCRHRPGLGPERGRTTGAAGPAAALHLLRLAQAAREGGLPRDTLERLSNLLGIYKSLQILLPDAAAADAWVRQPNSAAPFGGRSALERMLAGNVSDLNLVRRYLDGVRGGGWS
jgi:hypothetical protein